MRRRRLLLWAAAAVPLAQANGDTATPAGVEVNTASRAELESLPGLGPALVQRLLDARPFQDWPDLMRRVPGVKSATARKLSAAGLRVGGRHFSPEAQASGRDDA